MCKKLLIFVLMFGLVSAAIGQPTGQIMYEVWENIGGTAVYNLTSNPAYPDSPTYAELLTDFAAPVDIADNFGGRIHGYLYPELSGDYTFWIASDDASDLWLSTDDDPANAVVICSVSGWTSAQDWDGTTGAPGPDQMSAPIPLEGGGKYYISAIYKEGGGGDNCSVAWQGPDHPERALLAGHHLSPAPWAASVQKAQNPVPADGAVDVDTGILEWTASATAVSHVVYLNGELIAETFMTIVGVDLYPGMTYTWRVDEVQEDGTIIRGDIWSFTTLPLEPHFPSPANGAENVPSPVTLTWTPGKSTIINDVYYGTDEEQVAARHPNTFMGKFVDASYPVGDVELFSTYYWAVDAFTPGGTVPGPVWSFSTEEFVSIFTEEQTLYYDNSVYPYVSELVLDTPADLTAGGLVSDSELILRFQGQPENLIVDEETGTYTITGEGADIWGSSDAFHYVYMQLAGDGEISARVVSNGTGSNGWAKGGVMIRETNAPDSKHMIMALTGGDGNGIAFQGRAETGGNSASFHGDVTASPPYWVKLVREGNNISGYHSVDGETWELFLDTSPDTGGFAITNPQPVEMVDPVLIGLFVTSHAAGENRTYVFDNVDIQGDVDGVIVSEDIGLVSNDPEPIYVALEDTAGNVYKITHPDPAATQIIGWYDWRIPLSSFKGVDLTAMKNLIIGVGDGKPGGKGVTKFAECSIQAGSIDRGTLIVEVKKDEDDSWITGATVSMEHGEFGSEDWDKLEETSDDGICTFSPKWGKDYTITVIATGYQTEIREGVSIPDTGFYSEEFSLKLKPTGLVYPEKLIPDDSDYGDGDWLGRSVSISGEYAIAGAFRDNDDCGSAYIFENSATGWEPRMKLTALSPVEGEQFGGDVSISGEYAVIGANGAAYIFQHTNTGWNQPPVKLPAPAEGNIGDRFGSAVSINGDCAIIGASGDNDNGFKFNSGSAYIFRQDSTGWNNEKKLKALDGGAGDQFGKDVSISGNYAIVGANFANSNKVNGCGSAYVFWYNGSNWVQQEKLFVEDGNPGDEFGCSVCITDNYAIIGAIKNNEWGEGAGAAYIFEKSGNHWNEKQPYKLHPDNPYECEGDHFGNSVSIDGEYAVVAAVLDDDNGENSGSVYIFKLEGTTWERKAKLIAPDGKPTDFFGQGVSIDDNYVVVGAPYKNENGWYDSGTAYIFKRTDTTWSQ